MARTRLFDEQPVVCFAHVTNQMATVDGDFEKGEADGTATARAVIAATARALAHLGDCTEWM